MICIDLREQEESFADHVARGLSLPQKTISPKYLYDERGSRLFSRICELEEYYPTRSEKALLPAVAAAVSEMLPEVGAVIELGPGGPEKSRIFLERLRTVRTYVPVEISEASLADTCRGARAPEVVPVLGDFTACLGRLPALRSLPDPSLLLFLGSTLGNLDMNAACSLLQDCARIIAEGDGVLLLGMDFTQDSKTLHAAYNDREGVTAEFNLNLLDRMNRELGGNFRRENFRHHAFFNAEAERVEMHLVSQCDQEVEIEACALKVRFRPGETIHTESSRKFSSATLERMARLAGLRVLHVWSGGSAGAPSAQKYGVAALSAA